MYHLFVSRNGGNFARTDKFEACVRTRGIQGGGYARRMRINKMKRDKSLTKQRLNGVWETDRWNEFKSNSIVRSELFRTKLCTIFSPLSSIFGVSFALATRSWHVGAGRVAEEKLVERASWCWASTSLLLLAAWRASGLNSPRCRSSSATSRYLARRGVSLVAAGISW